MWIERVCSDCVWKLYSGGFWSVTRSSVLGNKKILDMMVSGRGQLKSLRNEFISLVFPSSVFLSQTLKNMNKKRADIIKKIQKYVMPKEKKKKGKRIH